MPRKINHSFIIVAIIILLSVPFIGCRDNAAIAPIATVKVERGNLTLQVEEVGVLDAVDKVYVRVKHWGKLTRLVDEETIVDASTPVAWMDMEREEKRALELESQVKSAEARQLQQLERLSQNLANDRIALKQSKSDYEFAKIKLEDVENRLQQTLGLEQEGLVSGSRLRQVRKEHIDASHTVEQRSLDVERTEARLVANEKTNQAKVMETEARFRNQTRWLRETRERILDATVVAPVGGLLIHERFWDWGTRKMQKVKAGERVSPRRPIMSIPDLSRFKIMSQVSEVEYHRIAEGMPVIFQVDAIPGENFNGEVQLIRKLAINRFESEGAGYVDRDDRDVPRVLEMEVISNDIHPSFRPGMTVSLQVIIKELKDQLLIPKEAIWQEQGENYVFLPDGSNGAVKTKIKLGEYSTRQAVILEGLEEGDEILLKPPLDLDE